MLVKLEWLGYRMVKKKLCRYVKPFLSDTGASRTDGQTDRRTDGQICYINIARQYADAIKTKNKIRRKRFSIWWMEFFHLWCGTWLWGDMLLNLPKRLPYWNSTPGFDFDHITAVDMSFCTSLRYFIEIGPPTAEKWRHVDFQDRGPIMGSLKSPWTIAFRFRKNIAIRFFDSIFRNE